MTTSPASTDRFFVVATAGHVDHGKSALVLRLTGMDPDRLEEEKRRGLTIDLGFAWTVLPSGREVGFVDVPGHDRFIRNMLAGVGPVRLVLFVVAADEGWKPQSEEHLQIVDLLGVDGAVIVLTKRDAVGAEALAERIEQVRARVAGTSLASAPLLPVSSVTGQGLDELRDALDAMLATAPEPERSGRPRQFLDRAFTIRGAGTVVTGTLTGGPLVTGQEAEVLPSGFRARIRGLQSHRRRLDTARPVSRVAVNLAGAAREDLDRGDALTVHGQWRATDVFDGTLRPVRGLARGFGPKGAYKVYAGSAEREARLRLLDATEIRPGDEARLVRIRLDRPVVLEEGDGFVLREAGRRETVGGGRVLDAHPPGRPGPGRVEALRRRLSATGPRDLAVLHVAERGMVRASDLAVATGVRADDMTPVGDTEGGAPVRVGGWLASPALLATAAETLGATLAQHHAAHPLQPGMEIGEVRAALAAVPNPEDPAFHPLADPAAAEAVLAHLERSGIVATDGARVRLPAHRASTAGRDDADRLVAAVAAAEPTPPTVRELVAAGFPAELIRAACADGRLVRVSPELVLTPGLLERAEGVVRSSGQGGVTVSAFREALGTTRKYAVPILEHFDARGLTRRQGDVRTLRG